MELTNETPLGSSDRGLGGDKLGSNRKNPAMRWFATRQIYFSVTLQDVDISDTSILVTGMDYIWHTWMLTLASTLSNSRLGNDMMP